MKLVPYKVYTYKYLHSCMRHALAHAGPIRNTLVDHWRMIWQEHAHSIIMVTNIKEDEKIKCQKYWPDNNSEDFGPFRITLSDWQMFANFIIRLLQVEVSISITL